ncbi:hypothetical protein [Dyadobacter crusticola]|uniref:hypothetical protein n=1 Tax=Dyadobacter crusticola TaxID=292407 RepID=UPI0004E13D07|nr:hypothetical protein [Dyadobacter crusticola]
MDFIENIWNGQNLEMLDRYLHLAFKDYSLPCGFQSTKGLSIYLAELNKSIIHKTTIQSVSSENNLVFMQVRIDVRPISDKTCQLAGDIREETIFMHRIFSFAGDQIIAHWEFF